MKGFYISTTEEQEKVNFVIEAFGRSRFGFENSIVEDQEMYRLIIQNKVAFGRYFLDKITGKECMGSIEGSYTQEGTKVPEMVDTNPLIEIKK